MTDTYKAHHIDYTVSDCRTTLPLTGLEPSDAGHPVFVCLVGAGEPYNGAEAPAILQAAAKGFVAASVAYRGDGRCRLATTWPTGTRPNLDWRWRRTG